MTLLPFPTAADGLTPEGLARAIQSFRPGFGEYLGAAVGEGFWSTSTGQMAARAPLDLDTAEGRGELRGLFRRQLGVGGNAPIAGVDDVFMSEEQWRSADTYREGLQYHGGITARVARSMADTFDDNQYRRWILDAGGGGFWRGVLGFGASVVGGAPAMENFIPFVGPATRMAMIGRFGRIGGRMIVEAGESAAGTALAAPFVLEGRRRFGDDVGFADGVLDVAMGAAFGAAFGGVKGVYRAWRDRGTVHDFRTVEEAHAAVEAAATAVAAGEPVRVPQRIVVETTERVRREVAAAEPAPAAVVADAPMARTGEGVAAVGGLAAPDAATGGRPQGSTPETTASTTAGSVATAAADDNVTPSPVPAVAQGRPLADWETAGGRFAHEWTPPQFLGEFLQSANLREGGRQERLVPRRGGETMWSELAQVIDRGGNDGFGQATRISDDRIDYDTPLGKLEIQHPGGLGWYDVAWTPTEAAKTALLMSGPRRDYSSPPQQVGLPDDDLAAAAARVGRPVASIEEAAKDFGLDPSVVAFDEAPAYERLVAEGKVSAAEQASVAAADALVAQADGLARAYDEAANCLLRSA